MRTIALTLIALAISSSTFASTELAKSKNCLTCHTIDKKTVGPAFKDVAKKYSEADQAKLVSRVLAGTKGNWGAIPMPPNKITEAEANELVTWILKQKG